MSEVVYDETLSQLLAKYRFDNSNIRILTPVTRFYYAKENRILAAIENIRVLFKKGCIFKLSCGKRNDMFFIYYTANSPEEIYRRLKLKAFL